MSRKVFTEEQMAALRRNPYVYRVTPTVLSLRKSFKEIFYREYMNGTRPEAIFEKYGFDTDALGMTRISGIAKRIKEEYTKYGESYEGCRQKEKTITDRTNLSEAEKEELKQLQQKVEYLKREFEFLKRFSARRKFKKRGPDFF